MVTKTVRAEPDLLPRAGPGGSGRQGHAGHGGQVSGPCPERAPVPIIPPVSGRLLGVCVSPLPEETCKWAPVKSGTLDAPKASLPQFPHVSGQDVVGLGRPGEISGSPTSGMVEFVPGPVVQEAGEDEGSAASSGLLKRGL